MRINDYFQITLKVLFRENKNKFYIMITIICTVLTLSIITFKSNFSNYINDSITKNIGFRTLSVEPVLELEDLGKEKLEDFNHVVDVYSMLYHSKLLQSDIVTKRLDGTVSLLYGTVKSSPSIIVGRGFKEKEQNVAICPLNFYPDEKAYELKINNEDIINGKDLLNMQFTVKYYSRVYNEIDGVLIDDEEFTKTFKIIGLYDNEQTMNFNNQCYIQSEDMKEIVDLGRPVMPEIQTSYPHFYVVVDNIYNVESVYKNISNSQMFDDVYVKNEIDVKLIKMVDISYNLILLIVLITILILNTSYIKKNIINQSKIIGILRTSGYDNKLVRNIYVLNTLVINLLSYIIGLILFIVLYLVLKNTLFSKVTYVGVKIVITSLPWFVSFIMIIVLSSLVSLYYISKKCNSDIIKLLGSEE